MANAIHYLLLFAKYPYAGKVKTRLEPALGIDGAQQFSRIALIELLRYFGQLNEENIAENVKYKCIWCYAPSEADQDVERLLKESNVYEQWKVWPQKDTAISLGDRLSSAISRATIDSYNTTSSPSSTTTRSTCTLIGSDCFQLTTAHITKATQIAAAGKAYIMPASDGGYVLLSIPLPVERSIFDGIRWSSAATASDQMVQLESAGYEVEIGETLSDVDEPGDLLRLLEKLRTKEGSHLAKMYPNTIAFVERRQLGQSIR